MTFQAIKHALTVLMTNPDNDMRDINCQEIIDSLHGARYISSEQMLDLYNQFLAPTAFIVFYQGKVEMSYNKLDVAKEHVNDASFLAVLWPDYKEGEELVPTDAAGVPSPDFKIVPTKIRTRI